MGVANKGTDVAYNVQNAVDAKVKHLNTQIPKPVKTVPIKISAQNPNEVVLY